MGFIRNMKEKKEINLNTIGKPKCGKPWKKLSKRVCIKKSFKKETWKARMAKNEKEKALKDRIKELREERNKEQEEKRLQRQEKEKRKKANDLKGCLLYTSPSPRDLSTSRMPSSA
eukprot:TRINITY_DN13391_c0_g1_i1.p3 TRINITY_DN13391_c0_g1~~TRINITY_DN13391_c0_g1_i1.p3  ORF type:complete len:116 (-),score=73.81 TRINITY_DN13391_c0_g1_i1:9-356(-)